MVVQALQSVTECKQAHAGLSILQQEFPIPGGNHANDLARVLGSVAGPSHCYCGGAIQVLPYRAGTILFSVLIPSRYGSLKAVQ